MKIFILMRCFVGYPTNNESFRFCGPDIIIYILTYDFLRSFFSNNSEGRQTRMIVHLNQTLDFPTLLRNSYVIFLRSVHFRRSQLKTYVP